MHSFLKVHKNTKIANTFECLGIPVIAGASAIDGYRIMAKARKSMQKHMNSMYESRKHHEFRPRHKYPQLGKNLDAIRSQLWALTWWRSRLFRGRLYRFP